MITTEELKVKLAEYGTAVKDLEEALAIEASRKRVQELEHTMSRPGFYDDAELSKKVFDEVGDLRGKLNRFEKLGPVRRRRDHAGNAGRGVRPRHDPRSRRGCERRRQGCG